MNLLQVVIGETKGELIARGTTVVGGAGWLKQLPDAVPEVIYCVAGIVGVIATIWTFIINRRNKLIWREKECLEIEILKMKNGIDSGSLKDAP